LKTKLTLRMEEELIERAKAWAKSRDVSLSDAVANFFSALSETELQPALSPWTRSLVGAARRPGEPAPGDDELRADYVDYLDRKYR
jgi:hypothetical protein